MFSTNSPFSVSGYGSQAHDLLPRMQAAGYELRPRLACVKMRQVAPAVPTSWLVSVILHC